MAKCSGHLKQLDTLRALAVAMVIVTHWGPRAETFWFNGGFGVKIFFVISGFLITGILLDARQSADRLGIQRGVVLKNFYMRRFLRIFPLFYATLLVTYLLGVPAVREYLVWLIPYTSNVLFALRGTWISGVAHFWSLAVEEQFYLVWPVLILFTPRRWLLPLILGAILFAPAYRLVGWVRGVNEVSIGVLPFACLDTLGLGALLALLMRHHGLERKGKTWWVLAIVAGAGCAAFFTLFIVTRFKDLPPWVSWLKVSMAAPTALGAVWLASRGLRGPVGWLMELAPVVYLGKISYGIYLFHPFVPGIVSLICAKLHLPDPSGLGPTGRHFVNLAALIAFCSLSWHCFESPINNLKRFFPYTPPRPAQAEVLATPEVERVVG